jgi:hypothetical protein
MAWKKQSKSVCLLAVLLMGMGLARSEWARALPPQGKPARIAQTPQVYVPSTNIPDDMQLVNADSNPTLRIPVSHSSLNWTLIKPRIRASFGWLEIDHNTVRFATMRPSRSAREPDISFEISRTDVSDLKTEFTVAEFRARGLRHFFGYSPQSHWDAADSPNSSVNSISKADSLYTPLIPRALQSFDSVVAELKLKQQAAAPPPVAVQPAQPPPPKPVAPPPAPTLVLMAPSGAGENQTLEVNESPLTIRGVAMDDSGLPTITINGAQVALRPKGANVAEFWSDPLTLKPGNNPFEIVATSPAKATSHFQFVAHFTPKTAPVNPRALDKEAIISLLQGSVPAAHVVELVRDRGIKFKPTPADLNDIRAAGGSEDLIQAIQQAAAAGK